LLPVPSQLFFKAPTLSLPADRAHVTEHGNTFFGVANDVSHAVEVAGTLCFSALSVTLCIKHKQVGRKSSIETAMDYITELKDLSIPRFVEEARRKVHRHLHMIPRRLTAFRQSATLEKTFPYNFHFARRSTGARCGP